MQNIPGTTNRIAIVTGAAGNLGRAIVKKFIDGNYTVVATDRQKDMIENDFAADKFEEAVVDLNDEAATQKFIEDVISKHKKIDAAILTAGGFAMGKIEDTRMNAITHQYKLNFETAYNTARPVFMQMIKQNSGRIFLMGSKPGLTARESKGKIAYGLSKSLIFYLAEAMNEEAKGKNVVVNVVVPGTIDTPQNREGMPGADFTKWTKPGAIADIIYWYCTEEAASLREGLIKAYNFA